MDGTHDPRSQEEKARADLLRNAEMGTAAVPGRPAPKPSVTPETFAGHSGRAPEAIEEGLRARDEDEAPRPAPGSDNDPARGGYLHADTRMGRSHSESLADVEETITGRPTDAGAAEPDRGGA